MESGARRGHLITQELWQPLESCQENLAVLLRVFKEHKWSSGPVLPSWSSSREQMEAGDESNSDKTRQHGMLWWRQRKHGLYSGVRAAHADWGQHSSETWQPPWHSRSECATQLRPVPRSTSHTSCQAGTVLLLPWIASTVLMQTGEEPAHSEACQGSHALPGAGWHRHYQERAHSFNHIKTIIDV